MKVSIGFFLLRVATAKLHIWIIRTVMVLTILFGPILFFVFTFQCSPISAFWSMEPSNGKCLDHTVLIALVFAISGLNVVADWTFGLLPFWIVKDLQIPKRQKRLVIGLLAFAAIGSTATCIRLPYVMALKESGKGREGDFLCKSGNAIAKNAGPKLTPSQIAPQTSPSGRLSRTALVSSQDVSPRSDHLYHRCSKNAECAAASTREAHLVPTSQRP